VPTAIFRILSANPTSGGEGFLSGAFNSTLETVALDVNGAEFVLSDAEIRAASHDKYFHYEFNLLRTHPGAYTLQGGEALEIMALTAFIPGHVLGPDSYIVDIELPDIFRLLDNGTWDRANVEVVGDLEVRVSVK
jgi:hypothetical protein